MNLARVEELLRRFASKRILVIGDLMLDEFIWGKVSRISPEAPVPVVNVTAESYYPGGRPMSRVMSASLRPMLRSLGVLEPICMATGWWSFCELLASTH